MTREVWLVEVHIVGTDQDPWLLLTDWPGTSEQSAARISAMYRERQGRRGQLQVFENVSGLIRGPGVGLAGGSRPWSPWAGSQLASSMGSAKARDWAEVQLLAKLGGS